MSIYYLVFMLLCSARVGCAGKLVLQGGQIRYFEEQFIKTTECAKKLLVDGSAEWDVPPLDPWKSSEPIDLNLDNKFIRTNVILRDVVAKGLTSFETKSLTLTPLMQLYSKYHFKKLQVSASHVGEFNLLGLLGFYGDGTIDVEFEDVAVDTYTQYRMVPPLIGDFRVTISVGKVKVHITGIDGDEDMSKYLSSIISQAAPLLINQFKNEISDVISPVIQKAVNMQIGDLSFLDYLAVVTTYSCG